VVEGIGEASEIWDNPVMIKARSVPDVLTPEQAAAYLQVNRETIYRYIRQGRLIASKLGRSYRIPKRGLDVLLWSTRTRPDVSLREYTGEQIEAFLAADQLAAEAQAIARRFLEGAGTRSTEAAPPRKGL
jgi:excisionase family DNA binding protein